MSEKENNLSQTEANERLAKGEKLERKKPKGDVAEKEGEAPVRNQPKKKKITD